MANVREYLLPVVIATAIPLGHAWRSFQPSEPLPEELAEEVRTLGFSQTVVEALNPPPTLYPQTRKPSLNAARLADLVMVRGIGPKFAKQLLRARPPGGFRGWADVDAIPGVGPKRLRDLQARFTLP